MKDQIFRTTVTPKPVDIQLSYQDQFLCIGSCFATHTAKFLETRKFKVLENPFGILYNPQSILNSLKRIAGKHMYEASELYLHNGLYHSWDHHGSFKHTEKETCLSNINNLLENAFYYLRSTSVCIITLGTSRVYRWKETGSYVANCHKVPAYYFNYEVLSIQKTTDILTECYELLKEINPEMKIIFSVSPIRHLADGAEGNSVSKSILRVAIDQIVSKNSDLYYFPAYEIMMDDLRDYRFYEADMIHPNIQAIGYILKLFEQNLFEDSSKVLMQKVLGIHKMKKHRSLFPGSKEDKRMKASFEKKVKALKKDYPFLEL